jgi:cytochrome c5
LAGRHTLAIVRAHKTTAGRKPAPQTRKLVVIRTLSIVAASVFTLGVGAAFAEAGADGLPEGPGHDTFVTVCSGCHAPELVLDKRMDYAGWDELVQTMVGRGASASPEEVKAITDYLAKNLPAPGAAPAAAAAAPAAAKPGV